MPRQHQPSRFEQAIFPNHAPHRRELPVDASSTSYPCIAPSHLTVPFFLPQPLFFPRALSPRAAARVAAMAGGKGKSSGGKSSGGKTSGVDGPKKQQSHSARAGLQVCPVVEDSFSVSLPLRKTMALPSQRLAHRCCFPVPSRATHTARVCFASIPQTLVFFSQPPRSEIRAVGIRPALAVLSSPPCFLATRCAAPSGRNTAAAAPHSVFCCSRRVQQFGLFSRTVANPQPSSSLAAA